MDVHTDTSGGSIEKMPPIGRGSMAQVEVITGLSRRRSYTEEQKRAVLAEASSPGVCVRDVIRRHDIPASSLYSWRKRLNGSKVPFVKPAGAFVPVLAVRSIDDSVIELEVGSSRIRIPGSITPALAAAVVSALVRP